MNYEGSRVAVIGLGGSGVAAARLLASRGASVTALDSADGPAARARLDGLVGGRIAGVLGRAAEEVAGPFDIAVLSPGVPPDAPIVRNLEGRGVPIIAEIELAYRSCRCPIVAVTGTNGKTTTTDLAARMLEGCGLRAAAAGNIGLPFSELVGADPSLDAVVLEVSSFQLERIVEFHPRVAVWLNFAPDHLDRYPDTAAYRAAKLRVFENQTGEDWAVVNALDPPGDARARRITFDAYAGGGDLSLRDGAILLRGDPVLETGATHLRGRHNAENIMAALGIGIALGLDPARLRAPVCAYRPRAHRMEELGEVRGVLYVNDSKSTNPDSLEKALLAMDRPVVLVAGGKEKGFDFAPLAGLIAGRARAAVLIGQIRGRLLQDWGARVPCRLADDLGDAVAAARELARPGDAVLLSPGTSSYDMFRDYEDRGEQFRALVRQLGD